MKSKPNRNHSSWLLKPLAAGASAAVLLFSQVAQAQTIPNPSFETDTFAVAPGYISDNTAITGWTGSPANQVGLNPAAGTNSFANNGIVPDGTNVAFLQVVGGVPATLETTITGLTPGATYNITFRINSNLGMPASNLKVFIDGAPGLVSGNPSVEGLTLNPVVGTSPYRVVGIDFVASAASQTLSIKNDTTTDTVLLVDDFKITAGATWVVDKWFDDATMGVDPQYIYTHAYGFGSATSFSVNGVPFTGVAGANPAVTNKFSTANMPNVFGSDTGHYVTGSGAAMANAFLYGFPGGAPSTFEQITMTNLTPGKDYVVTVFSTGWEQAALNNRWMTMEMQGKYLTVNQDRYMYLDGRIGIRFSCAYKADGTGTATVAIRNFVSGGMHVYGFCNREAVASYQKPVVVTQPRSTVVSPGAPVDFSVLATGFPTPDYQWRSNGVVIAGAPNSATYTTPGLAPDFTGLYDVIISNLGGSVTSSVAQVKVGRVPVANSSFEANTFLGYGSITANGPITDWSWSYSADQANNFADAGLNPTSDAGAIAANGITPLGGQVAFLESYATDSNVLSQAVSGFTIGHAYYVHYYENGSAMDGVAPILEVRVAGQTVMPAHSVTIINDAAYHSVPSGMFVATAETMNLAFALREYPGSWSAVLIDNVSIFEVGSGVAPTISLQPKSVTANVGSPASFDTVAQGSMPLSYQWRFNGQPIVGATNSSFAIASLVTTNTGSYTLVVANSSGSVTSSVAQVSVFTPIPSLFNTGVNASRAPLGALAVDPHFTMTVSPDTNYPGPNAIVCDGSIYPFGYGWPAQGPNSGWITPKPDNLPIAGNYTFRTTFDLTGRDPSSVVIMGRWMADDSGASMSVNGTPVVGVTCPGFAGWTDFTLNAANATFVAGTNTLDFVLHQTTWAGGIRIEFPTSTASDAVVIVPAVMTITPSGTDVTISWTPIAAGQKLQSATSLTGPWTDVPGATSPHTTAASGSAMFYRVTQ